MFIQPGFTSRGFAVIELSLSLSIFFFSSADTSRKDRAALLYIWWLVAIHSYILAASARPRISSIIVDADSYSIVFLQGCVNPMNHSIKSARCTNTIIRSTHLWVACCVCSSRRLMAARVLSILTHDNDLSFLARWVGRTLTDIVELWVLHSRLSTSEQNHCMSPVSCGYDTLLGPAASAK